MAGLVGAVQRRLFPTHHDDDEYNNNTENWGAAPRYEDAVNPSNARRMPSTAPHLTPYLGLRSRLSQVWLNRWTVLLLLILVRVLMSTTSMDNDLESARDKALSACTGVESMGSSMASMPFYMAKGVNEMTAKGIESAVRALEKTLMLLITGVQEMVVFVVNLIVSTYVCLITFAVHATVGAIADAVQGITDFINSASDKIFNGIEDDIKSAEDGFNKFLGAIQSIPNFFGKDQDPPTVTIPSADELKNGFKIPDTIANKVKDLENKLPTFSEIKEAGDNAIRIPFKLISDKVNNSLGIYEFDRSVFPVPEKEKLTFCSDNPAINDFFDNLKHVVNRMKKILAAIIALLAILSMIPMAYREWHSYRRTRERAYILSDPSREFDPVDVVYIATRPHTAGAGLKLSSNFQSSRRQILVRWAVAYVTSPPALFVLSLGIAGLVSVLCQYILLRQVETRAPALAAQIGEFAGLVVDKLNGASQKWAVETNSALNQTNAELNKEVFGWVVTGTDAMNDTMNTFVNKMHEGVKDFFLDTPIGTAVNDILDCLITIKIRGIQKGLTWAHNNAHVTLPTVSNDTFSLGAMSSVGSDANPASSFLSDPDSVATDQITDVVLKLTEKWEQMLRQEAAISGAVTGIWFILVLIALVRTLVFFWGKDKVRGDGGPVPLAGEGRNQPVFPTFGPSPNTPNGPPSPDQYPGEKVSFGTVNGGQMPPAQDGGSSGRRSFYPQVEVKR